MGGTPVFAGSTVPVHVLFDYLERGDNVENFLRDNPSVAREYANEVLELAKQSFYQSLSEVKFEEDQALRFFWQSLGNQAFQKAYGEDEPDYSDAVVMEPNPKYGE